MLFTDIVSCLRFGFSLVSSSIANFAIVWSALSVNTCTPNSSAVILFISATSTRVRSLSIYSPCFSFGAFSLS